MRLLLDTPVWIWSLLEPERLDQRVRETLQAGDAELWLSPLSVWELLAMIEDGRVSVDGDPDTWVAQALRAVPLHEAALSHEVVRRVRRWRDEGLSPVARLLAATAHVYDLTLVTADSRFAELEGVRVLADR